VATVVSIFLPNFTEKPQYDFLYMKVGETQIRYIVKAGLTGKGKIDKFSTNGSTNVVFPKLFFYDVSTNTNYEISFSAAEKFSLDSRKMSKDGFSIKHGFLSNWKYLQKKTYRKLLNLDLSLDQRNNFTFLGWVNKE
jgi:hypothetical protein